MSEVEIRYPDYPYKKCLDKGFIALVDHMGNDARIVQSARVSYQAGTKAVQTDRHLIRYLVRNLHTTPLEKVRFEFHVKLPIFIARQWMRHRTGSFNEVSARYSVLPKDFYIPDELRKQSKTNRQGSSDETISELPTFDGEGGTVSVKEQLENICGFQYTEYEGFISEGVAREQARMVLPLNIYTEFFWTVDLWNLMHFLRLRIDPHAQKEIRVYAESIVELIEENCELEYALEAFKDYIVDKPNISKFEVDAIKNVLKDMLGDEYTKFLVNMKEEIGKNDKMSNREKVESKIIAYLS